MSRHGLTKRTPANADDNQSCHNYTVSQGSAVMHFGCGRIFNNSLITNFPESLTVRENFENPFRIDKAINQPSRTAFLRHSAHYL